MPGPMVLVLALPAVALLAACASQPPATPTPLPRLEAVSQPPAGRYLFVETWTSVDGSGDLPMVMIDFPTYSLNPDEGTLEFLGWARPESVELSSEDWGYVGSGADRRQGAGGGAASGLKVISALPYTGTVGIFTGEAQESGMEQTRQCPVILEAVDAQGGLRATIDGAPVLLEVGEAWTRTVEADVTTGAGWQGHYSVTSTVTNYGWFDRSNIRVVTP